MRSRKEPARPRRARTLAAAMIVLALSTMHARAQSSAVTQDGISRAQAVILHCVVPGTLIAVPCGTTANPLVDRLRAVGRAPLTPKQAWTPVAEFAAFGLDAVNFGPGDPRQAHTVQESVPAESLAWSYATLLRFAGDA